MQERIGGGGKDNGRNFYFSNFAKKPAGDWVVGDGRTGSDTALLPPPRMRASDLGLAPQVGARLGAHLPEDRRCGGRESRTAAPTPAASGA